jgi:hypothetical protein
MSIFDLFLIFFILTTVWPAIQKRRLGLAR